MCDSNLLDHFAREAQIFFEKMDFDQTRPDSIGGAIQAVIANDLKGLQGLSEKGHSMRICDNRGYTPLHHAVQMGHINCIKWLIQQGKYTVTLNLYLLTAGNGNRTKKYV